MPKLAIVIAIALAIGFPAQQDWRPTVAGTHTFVSPEGRFSIALPERTGFSQLSIPTPVGLARGDMYQWRTKEATFGVGYADAPQTLSDPDVPRNSIRLREACTYEFDSRGNWIKRTTFRIVTKDGREERQPQSVYFRTITY